MWQVALGWHDMEFAKRTPYWNSTPGFNFDHITAVDMLFCTSLRNFIQIGPPAAEKMTSRRFSRWWISALLDFMDQIMGSLKSPCTTSYRSSICQHSSKLVSFWENRVFAFWRQNPRWRISAILDFRDPIMGSLKSQCTTSYRSSINSIALNCLVFDKIAFFLHFGDRQTNIQTDRQTNRWTASLH